VEKKRFSVEQIVAIFEAGRTGIPIAELILRVGVSEQTFTVGKRSTAG